MNELANAVVSCARLNELTFGMVIWAVSSESIAAAWRSITDFLVQAVYIGDRNDPIQYLCVRISLTGPRHLPLW